MAACSYHAGVDNHLADFRIFGANSSGETQVIYVCQASFPEAMKSLADSGFGPKFEVQPVQHDAGERFNHHPEVF